MPEAIKDIVVRIRAEKSGFESLDDASAKITEIAGATVKAETATKSFVDRITQSAAGLERVGHFGATMMNILDRIEISELNVANAQMSVTNSQLRYNEAVEKYGKSSAEALVSSNHLERAQNQLAKANNRATDSMVLVGITMVGQIPAIVSFGRSMITTLKSVELSTASMSIRLKALAPEILILSAVAGGMYYLTQQARAAEETMGGAFDSINAKAGELKQTIEEIKNSMVGFEQRAAEAQIKLVATQAAIAESSLSADEKRKQNEAAILEFNQQIRDIRLSADREALKNGGDQKAIYEDMGKILEDNAKAELERQKEVSGFRGLRGPSAGAGAIGVTGAGRTPVSADFAVSPFLKSAISEKEAAVRVVEFLGSKNLATTSPQYNIREGPAELGRMLLNQPWKLFTGVNINDVVTARNASTPAINNTVNISLDSKDVQNLFDRETVRTTGRGVTT